jgi:hypothetical protein
MMAFANTEDPWIDYLIISRLGGCYATPIIQNFQDRRFRIKIDPQLESATQPKARGLKDQMATREGGVNRSR